MDGEKALECCIKALSVARTSEDKALVYKSKSKRTLSTMYVYTDCHLTTYPLVSLIVTSSMSLPYLFFFRNG